MALRNAVRSPSGVSIPSNPPSAAVGSADSALATVEKSAPDFSSLSMCSAFSCVSTTMMRTGTLATCGCTATQNIDNNPRANQHRSDLSHILPGPTFTCGKDYLPVAGFIKPNSVTQPTLQ